MLASSKKNEKIWRRRPTQTQEEIEKNPKKENGRNKQTKQTKEPGQL